MATGLLGHLMLHIRRPARPLPVVFISFILSTGFVLSGCGLFGGGDDGPQIVEPPAAAAQEQAAEETPAAAEAEAAEEEQAAPVAAVPVTTSPSDDSQQQQPASPAAEAPAETPAGVYVVQAGDTLAGIANALGVRIDDLISLNGIQNPDVLNVGQELRIPGAETGTGSDAAEESAADDGQEQAQEDAEAEEEGEENAPPTVELPTVAVPAATPTVVSYSQFPQPGPEETADTIPSAPANFLQYGAAALPWLHGETSVDSIIELFQAWPMPPLAVGNDRVVLIDTNAADGFSAAIVYTDPNSFGADVPFSNLVVYDPVPGDASKYRIAYDHAQAYAREVQGIQQLADADLTGDSWRDLAFREITCDSTGCVSVFYVLSASGDGYRTITGSAAQVVEVTGVLVEDRTGDGAADLVVEGYAADESPARRYSFIFTVQGDALVEAVRVALDVSLDDPQEEEPPQEAPSDEMQQEEPPAEEDLLEEEEGGDDMLEEEEEEELLEEEGDEDEDMLQEE